MAEALGSPSAEPEMHLPSKPLWLTVSFWFFPIVPNHNLLSYFLVSQNDTRSLFSDTLSAFLQGEQSPDIKLRDKDQPGPKNKKAY